MTQPNIPVDPGGQIPSGYVVGRMTPGTGAQELISFADICNQVIAMGIVPAPGAASSLAPIADQRFLANLSGSTAAPIATAFTDMPETIGGHTDANASLPSSTATAGWAITSNYGNDGNVDLWNTVEPAGFNGFNFRIKTGASTEKNFGYIIGDTAATNWGIDADGTGTYTCFFYVDNVEGAIGTDSNLPFNIYANSTISATFPTTGGIALTGSTSGSITIKTPAVAGTHTLTLPAGTTDFSATGPGAVVQASAGSAFTVETLVVGRGGTGQTSYTDGQLLIGNSTGNTLAKATLTAGSGITITNGSGAITVAASGGGGGVGGLYAGALSSTLPTSANTGLTTWRNQGGASVADVATGVCITCPAGAGDSLRCREKAVPSTPYTITALLAFEASGQNFQVAGIGWNDGTKLETIHLTYNGGWLLEVAKWTTVTAFSAADVAGTTRLPGLIWLQINDDGTNVAFRSSMDGVTFRTVYSVAKASGFLGSTGYSNVMFFGNRNNSVGTSSAYVTLMSWAVT